MTKLFKVTLVSLAVLAGASAAQAGDSKGFDLELWLQEVEAGGSLYRD